MSSIVDQPLLARDEHIPSPSPSMLKSLLKAHVLWLYLIPIFFTITSVPSDLLPLLLLLLAQVYVLYYILNRHKPSLSSQAALRWRLLATSLLWAPLQFMLGSFLLGIIMLIPLFIMGSFSDLLSDLPPVTDPSFSEELQKRSKDWSEHLTKLLDSDKLLVILLVIVPVFVLYSLYQALTLRVLVNGYFAMITTRTASGLQLQTIRMRDIVDFAMVGALGLFMGRNLFQALSQALLMSLIPLPSFNSIPLLLSRLLSGLAALVAILLEQAFIALAVAERDVLGKSQGVRTAILAVCAVDVILRFLLTFCGYTQKAPSWVAWGIAPVLYVVVLLGFGSICRRRYYAVCSEEDSENRLDGNEHSVGLDDV